MAEQRVSLGPVGEALRRNVRRIREGQRLTYVDLSKKLAEAGRSIPVLGLRRIEQGERRVDADDLLALAYVLGVSPVDLLVDATAADDEPYGVTAAATTTAGVARRWIGGDVLTPPASVAELAGAIRWMPKERADAITRKWLMPMQREGLRAENRRLLAEADDEHAGEGPQGEVTT